MKKFRKFLLVVIIFIIFLRACGSKSDDEDEEYTKFYWPTSDVVSLLPVPKSNVGAVGVETADYFSVSIAKTSKDEFNDYVLACKEAGFTENYYATNNSYNAKNKDNYTLMLSYKAGNIMHIAISAPPTNASEAEQSTLSDDQNN